MPQTLIEKILARHADREAVRPGEIVDIVIDVRLARDFGGANVAKNLLEHNLGIDDPGRTRFTFDCNPTGSDQKYAANQHACRRFARERGIRVYDIDAGIGTHLSIDEGLAVPGCTLVSTDSHANILGAIGAFGQGMGDRDIAAAFAHGKVWFKVPPSVKLTLTGKCPAPVTAKDLVLNLLERFGANELLGYAVELHGEAIDALTLDDRITVASMATEMGAISLLIPPSEEVNAFCRVRANRAFEPVFADPDAVYDQEFTLDLETFVPRVSLPGHPEITRPLAELGHVRVDSCFIGSCTNGRFTDLRAAADVLRGRKLAPGVVLKIVPATNAIWDRCLEQGLIRVFKEAGALVSNAGCAGCAAGQVGQNGPGEVSVSTGNRNFAGKQGKGEVYLASPAVVAASAVAGFIAGPDGIEESFPAARVAPPAGVEDPPPIPPVAARERPMPAVRPGGPRPTLLEGRVWVIDRDNIDTDMIFHNRYLAITELAEMGQYTFDNLAGYEDFARRVQPGDVVVTARNFGAGSSRQQAVDCFKALGVAAIVARSFGAIYERNAINAGFPILTHPGLDRLGLADGDRIQLDLEKGTLTRLADDVVIPLAPFSTVQMAIYQRGDLLAP